VVGSRGLALFIDTAGSYSETLTMSATPHLTSGVPDGSEAISGLQSLSRDYLSAGGQDVRSDAYFNLSSCLEGFHAISRLYLNSAYSLDGFRRFNIR